jgi:hypothetical protein
MNFFLKKNLSMWKLTLGYGSQLHYYMILPSMEISPPPATAKTGFQCTSHNAHDAYNHVSSCCEFFCQCETNFEQFACGKWIAEFSGNFVFNTVFLPICEITISGQLVEFALEKPVMQHKTTIVQLL